MKVIQSKLFKTVVQGSDGDYELSVRVTSLSKPLFGGTFTVGRSRIGGVRVVASIPRNPEIPAGEGAAP